MHLDTSYDGLKQWEPLDLYGDDITSTRGLLAVLRRLQVLQGFGDVTPEGFGHYSMLLVDVTIFWQLLRLLYCYSGMSTIRHDLFLCFGLWHPYSYAHIALWDQFRHTFLGPAFFALFPDQRLLRRPKLVQSATFLTWLRMAYPAFREQLKAAIGKVQASMILWERERIRSIRQGLGLDRKSTSNPFRAPYVHLRNLETLFEFCIPCIQDYGIALKLNDFLAFGQACTSLFRFFACCSSKGSRDYQRSMYIFMLLSDYWGEERLPVSDVLQRNHTLFSEESGEIALSVLAQSQPPSHRADLEATRQQWQLVAVRYKALREKSPQPPKKHRLIGTLYSSLLSLRSYSLPCLHISSKFAHSFLYFILRCELSSKIPVCPEHFLAVFRILIQILLFLSELCE